MQGQMEDLNRQTQALNDKMQLMMEQLVLSKKDRFGRSSEKMSDPEQIRFMEVDGTIVFFNEAEAVCDLDAPEPEDLKLKPAKKKKQAGKKTAGIAALPASVEIEEHHIGVYSSKLDEHMIKAPHPRNLLHGSLVSSSLAAAVINGKYVNAVPLYRLEKEFERYGLAITRQNMANWMRHRSSSIKMDGQLEAGVICGFTGLVLCIRSVRSSSMNTRRHVMPRIPGNS